MRLRFRIVRATAFACAAVAAVLAVPLTGTPARADVDVRIDIGNAPPPPDFAFVARPHERIFPGERIYVVDDPRLGDDDCFRYHGYYWVFRDGYWYRSRGWRSRFVVVHPRYVPTEFYRLPSERWKHHPNGPPGLMKKGGPPGQMKKGEGGPPGQMKKGDRHDDRRDDRNR